MLVEMLVSMAGADFYAAPGQVVEREGLEAKRLIEAGFAKPVKQAKVEKAATRSKTTTTRSE